MRNALKVLFAPIMLLGFNGAAVWIVAARVSLFWLAPLLAAAVVFAAVVEQLVPFEPAWNGSHGDLCRDLIHAGVNQTVNLTSVAIIPPESDYYNRLNQLDLRLGKILKFGGRSRMNLSLDLYNLFNEGTITAAAFTYTTWLEPSAVIAPRLAKVSMTFDF